MNEELKSENLRYSHSLLFFWRFIHRLDLSSQSPTSLYLHPLLQLEPPNSNFHSWIYFARIFLATKREYSTYIAANDFQGLRPICFICARQFVGLELAHDTQSPIPTLSLFLKNTGSHAGCAMFRCRNVNLINWWRWICDHLFVLSFRWAWKTFLVVEFNTH